MIKIWKMTRDKALKAPTYKTRKEESNGQQQRADQGFPWSQDRMGCLGTGHGESSGVPEMLHKVVTTATEK